MTQAGSPWWVLAPGRFQTPDDGACCSYVLGLECGMTRRGRDTTTTDTREQRKHVHVSDDALLEHECGCMQRDLCFGAVAHTVWQISSRGWGRV